MKKLFLFLSATFLLFGVSQSNAQNQEQEKGKLTFGVKGGLNAAWYHYDSSYRENRREDGEVAAPKLLLQLGAFGDYAVSEVFSLQSGLIFNGKGSRGKWAEQGYNDDSGKWANNLWYLEVPVYGVYKTGNLFFGAGPYLGLGLFGNWKNEINWENGTERNSGKINFSKDEIEPVDFGVNLMGGYQLNDNWLAALNFGYQLNSTVKNAVISFSVGYFLK